MVEYARGNLLEADVEALVNTVNCVGVMGKGVALQFKQAFPENYRQYKKACDAGEVQPGRMFVVPTGSMINPRYVINFPTKRHWRGKSRLEDIKAGLAALVDEARRLDIRSIAIPPLGSGMGGLQWAQVKPLMAGALAGLPQVRVVIYEPLGAPKADSMPVATMRPRMTLGRALFIRLIELYRTQGYSLSLLEIQKLAYFLQSAGLDLKLDYSKHKYGPYAETVHHVLQRMEGHYIRGYGDRSQRAGIYLLPEAAQAARDFISTNPEAIALLDRVGRLIEGFETPYGMELLATVHWLAHDDPRAAVDLGRAIAGVRSWSSRKELKFPAEHINKAWSRLQEQDWFPTD